MSSCTDNPMGYTYEIGFGDVPQYSTNRKFGEVNCATKDVEYTIGYGSNTRIPKLTTEYNVNVVSSSTSDTSAGVGVRTFFIGGVGADFSYRSETITMNGTTNVLSVNKYIFIERGYVLTAGSSNTNVGDITITTTNGDLLATIQALHGQTQIACYVVHKGEKTMPVADDIAVEKAGAQPVIVSFRGILWSPDRSVYREVWHQLLDQTLETHHHLVYPFNDVFQEGWMLEMTAISNTNATPVRCMIWLVNRNV